MTSHKMRESAEYRAWRRMKGNCYNKNVPGYRKYGAKGIAVCNEWKTSFSQFYKDMGPMPKTCNGLELVDNTKDFCKLNCKWTKKAAGRPIRSHSVRKPNTSHKKIKHPKTVCIVLEKEHFDFIKRQAMQKSLNEGRLINPNEMMRDALKRSFPCSTQCDMFGGAA